MARGLTLEGCEALLVLAESSRDPDVAPFVGAVHLGLCFVIVPRGAPPALGFLTAMEREEAAATGCRLLSPEQLAVDEIRDSGADEPALWAELISRALADLEVPVGKLALAGRSAAGRVVGACAELSRRGWELADGRGLLLRARKRKGEKEIADARVSAAGTCAAFRRVAEVLATSTAGGAGTEPGAAGTGPGPESDLRLGGERLTVGRLRQEIARQLATFGLEQPEGNIVAVGRDAGIPHSTGADDDPVVPGRAVVVDLFPRGRVFADCTRTFCVGPAPESLVAAHDAVREALAAAHSLTRAGVRAWDLQQSACEVLEAAGHPTPRSHPGTREGYVHGLGHGVGYEIHELPSFRRQAESDGLIEPGDLLTLEPGLYYPDHRNGGFGVRLEDLLLVTDSGTENLTPLPYELDPDAWLE